MAALQLTGPSPTELAVSLFAAGVCGQLPRVEDAGAPRDARDLSMVFFE